jgi:hypothetical protein
MTDNYSSGDKHFSTLGDEIEQITRGDKNEDSDSTRRSLALPKCSVSFSEAIKDEILGCTGDNVRCVGGLGYEFSFSQPSSQPGTPVG